MTGWGGWEGLGPDQLGVVQLQTGGFQPVLRNSGQQAVPHSGRPQRQASAASSRATGNWRAGPLALSRGKVAITENCRPVRRLRASVGTALAAAPADQEPPTDPRKTTSAASPSLPSRRAIGRIKRQLTGDYGGPRRSKSARAWMGAESLQQGRPAEIDPGDLGLSTGKEIFKRRRANRAWAPATPLLFAASVSRSPGVALKNPRPARTERRSTNTLNQNPGLEPAQRPRTG